ncbi:conserved hypothetical protein [Neospora caninum Liverpool]|uniref:Uncharacterized protein n=1 Tax=Neospora caninum (strain Liverpool) TaxID=572307 RepID=F0VFJ9_NEOCL|nr:conserved hypothetical protein [Neospora caninum Liverpool]CBZ52493.1 conserved hypothetical protein [Neospora caninum Liverpool]CEL66470.1 TPA: hypothetical protein BN1204_022820 [Neospora caninum Liverpool]|eukprot:XP_003882525.1 conserved hypothetical protein [Neospora caninum Liverpool]
MAAAPGKVVVVPPPVLKKPNIVIKKPLVPVSPAAGVKKPGSGGPVKPPPPKPVLVSKKLPGEDAGPPGKKPFLKPAAKPSANAKAAPSKSVQDNSVKAAKAAKQAAKPVSKKAGGAEPGATGKAKAAKAGATAKTTSSGGFFSRMFRRKKDEAPEEQPKPVVVKPVPKFEKVQPRKFVGKKLGTGSPTAKAFQPRFGKADGSPSASPKFGLAADDLCAGAGPKLKASETPPAVKALGSSAPPGGPKPPAVSPKPPVGLPPLKAPKGLGAKEATDGKGPGPSPGGLKPGLPKILPKKPPAAPGLEKKLEVKKVEIVPKKLPSASEKAKESGKEPPPGKSSEGSKTDAKSSGAENDGKKPSPVGLGKQREALKGAPAPKRTLADLLAKGSAAAAEPAEKDNSLVGKVKSFLGGNPQYIPEDEKDLKSPDVSEDVLNLVREGVEASPAEQNAIKNAVRAVYELIDGKLGPEPVAKEVQKDNPKVVEARDWIAVAQEIKASAVAVRTALENLKKEKERAFQDLLNAPFKDSAKFRSLAEPVISAIQERPETASLSSRAIQAELADVVAHHQAVTDLKAYLEKEPNIARSIVDAYKFKAQPAAGAKAPTAGAARGPTGTAGGVKVTSAVGGAKFRTAAAGRPGFDKVGTASSRALGGGAVKRLGAKGRGPQPKESLNTMAEKLFNEAMTALTAAFGEKYRAAILIGVVHELESTLTIPKGTCWLADILLTADKTTGIFDHHQVLTYMFGFFDSTSYLRFRECSKLTHRAVEMDLDKRLYHLPLQTQSALTDIGYFYHAVSFFCRAAARLAPLDRMKYLPPSVLKAAEWMVPVSRDALRSHVFVSLDRLPHDMISLAEAERPLPHLWRKSHSKVDPLGKAISTEIDLHDFISEYRQRVSVVRDEIVWQHPVDDLDEDSVCALVQHLFKILKQIAERHNGFCLFRRSEYLINTDIHITHRIWLQCVVSWGGVLEVPESMKRLYLTISDNFSWDG